MSLKREKLTDQKKLETYGRLLKEKPLSLLYAEVAWIAEGISSWRFWFTRSCVRAAAKALMSVMEAFNDPDALSPQLKAALYSTLLRHEHSLKTSWLFPWDRSLLSKIETARLWVHETLATCQYLPVQPPSVSSSDQLRFFKDQHKPSLTQRRERLLASLEEKAPVNDLEIENSKKIEVLENQKVETCKKLAELRQQRKDDPRLAELEIIIQRLDHDLIELYHKRKEMDHLKHSHQTALKTELNQVNEDISELDRLESSSFRLS